VKIRSQTHTALLALLDLCLHAAPQSPASLSEVARRQSLSIAFLEQLFRKLKEAGLVAPWRGMKGGYTLARAPEAISLWDVFRALEDPMVKVQAGQTKEVQPEEATLRQAFRDLEQKWEKDLRSTNLARLREEALKNPQLDSAPKEGVRFQI
jgi:Rrf2 family iron-sulfur cluster assembly transcriptional regulator